MGNLRGGQGRKTDSPSRHKQKKSGNERIQVRATVFFWGRKSRISKVYRTDSKAKAAMGAMTNGEKVGLVPIVAGGSKIGKSA